MFGFLVSTQTLTLTDWQYFTLHLCFVLNCCKCCFTSTQSEFKELDWDFSASPEICQHFADPPCGSSWHTSILAKIQRFYWIQHVLHLFSSSECWVQFWSTWELIKNKDSYKCNSLSKVKPVITIIFVSCPLNINCASFPNIKCFEYVGSFTNKAFHRKGEKIKTNIQKLNSNLSTGVYCFCLSSSINHLTTPQIYFVNFWRDQTPMLVTTGLNYVIIT